MAETPTDVLVGGYPDINEATKDFDALAKLVEGKKVKLEAAILITHAQDGTVTVAQTADHRGRKGVEWGGSVGFLVGLAAPPLLAVTAAGAVAGGLVGKFVDKRLETEMHDKIGENLPPGTAGIIATFDDSERLAVEQALPGALAKSTVQTDKKGVKALKDGLAEAMGKFVPDRTVLPIPDKNFGGTIGRTIDQSVPDWTIIPGPKAPDGAPNVLLVLIDDAGFGRPDTFGGPVATPNLTRVGKMGVTYNRFHVVALCSPTRAATLTGRNQHRVGMGSVAEFPGPFPGYTGAVPRTCAPFPRILKDNGYVTGGFGKWHMTPDREQGAAGPFDHWPHSWGFCHYLGLPERRGRPMGSADDGGQHERRSARRALTEAVLLPGRPDRQVGRVAARRPRTGSREAVVPLLLDPDVRTRRTTWRRSGRDKYKGKFDQGWDKLREEAFERQKKLGVIPQDAVLTERPDLFDAWDSLDDASKKLYTRQMEVYAGFMDNADWNVGRLLDAVEEMGDLDNTLIFYIWGDNGASLEGTTTGSFNEMTFLNGVDIEPKQQLELIDKYGGIEAWGNHHTAPHIAAAWAWAGNTPFQWGKQMASHLGGTRNPMVVAWPGKIKAGGDLRSQFTHCIDIGPTILEAAGIPGGEGGRWDRAGADGRYELPVHVRRPECRGAAHGAVLRGDRLACDLQGRLVGVRAPRQGAVGVLAGGTRSVRSRQVGPGAGHLGAVLPAGRLHAGKRSGGREAGEAGRAEGAVLAGGGAQSRAAAPRRRSAFSSASFRRCRR